MFPPLVVLVGTCLVVLGSRWPVATMPMGDTVLGDASQIATWVVRAGAALVVAGLILNRRWRWVAWFGWIITAVALIYVAQNLWMQIAALKQQAAGDPDMMRMVEQTLEKTRLRPGAAYLAGGLILQLFALMFRPKTRGPAERPGVSPSRA
jgi:hypothetical protein